MMKIAILACLVAIAVSAPQGLDERDAEILRDDRVAPENGAYSFDFETSNGIQRSEGGQPEGEAGATNKAGDVSFTLPDGQQFNLKFVANENGYQPESDFLPVAPAFPHPIPDFVLRQIEFGEQLRAERERSGRN